MTERNQQEATCPRCNAAMQAGRLAAGGDGVRFAVDWLPSERPKPKFLDPVRPDGGLPVTALRCVACGLLEFRALPL